MKRVKYLLLIIFIFLVTGCSANYDLTLDKDIIDEKLTLIMTKDEFSKNYNTLIADKSVFDSNDVLYDTEIIDNNDNYLVTYSHTYNHDEYFDSLNLNSCFNNIEHHIDNNLESFYLEGFNCLQDSSLRVIVDSKYKIYNSNARIINGNKNIWDINTSNKDNIAISFVVDYNKTYFNSNWVASIILVIVLIGLIAALFLRRKRK